jgi:DNA-binding protein Fis
LVHRSLNAVGPGTSLEDLLLLTLGELHFRAPEDMARKQLEAAVGRAASQCVANHAWFGPRVYEMLLVEVQRALIRRALEECNGMLSRAATLLGLTLHELETHICHLGLRVSSSAMGL